MEQTVSQNRRIQHRKWLPWAALLALLMAGCGDSSASSGSGPGIDAGAGGSGGTGGRGEGSGGAAGAGAPPDSGVSGLADNPVDQLFADPGRNAWDALGAGPDAAAGYAESAHACYDNAYACGSPECSGFASCCVKTGSCCAPILEDAALPAALDFRQCAGQTADQCAELGGSDAPSFGESEPVLSGRGLIPNGSASEEGGALIGDAVNLSTQRAELEVQFTLPLGCNGTCLESAGVAFTAEELGAFVDAGVGLLLSGSREVVNLMIGNAVADSFDAGNDDTRWRLVLSPDGSAQAFRDGNLLGTYPFDAVALQAAQLVVFGRNLGAADTSAAIAVVEVAMSFCDNPTAWDARQPVGITLSSNPVPAHAFGNAPSLVDQGVSKRIAYEVDSEIFVAEEAAPAEFFLEDGQPALVATEPYEALGVSDPELVSDGNRLYLFYSAWDASSVGTIGVAASLDGNPSFVKRASPTLTPEGDAISYDAPSVLFRDGLWLLIVRATLADGTTELRAFYTSDIDSGWARVVNGGLEALTRSEGPTSEVTDPSLIIHNSAYQLYYARRTGTRWAVELAVSDELLLWRFMGDVLGDSSAGYDSLGARSPDALSQPDRVELVYAGQDGVSFRLGAASRAAPSDTAPSIF